MKIENNIVTDEHGNQYQLTGTLTPIEDEIEIGELVHCWDLEKEAGMKRVGAYEGQSLDSRYITHGVHWRHIARPTTFPEIRIKFNGTKCPKGVEDKTVTVWWKGGTFDTSTYPKGRDVPWPEIDFYLVHRD